MKIAGIIGAVWGFVGVLGILGYAIIHLASISMEALSFELLWYHWLALIGNTLFMIYSEGYRGFQPAFSPRVAARAKYLSQNPTSLDVLLAPLFCVGYYKTSKRRKTAICVLTIAIMMLIGAVRLLDQPWRGIIDAGVVVGLSWGIVATSVYMGLAFTSKGLDYDPEIVD